MTKFRPLAYFALLCAVQDYAVRADAVRADAVDCANCVAIVEYQPIAKVCSGQKSLTTEIRYVIANRPPDNYRTNT